jgi:serine/threonine protein kinase
LIFSARKNRLRTLQKTCASIASNMNAPEDSPEKPGDNPSGALARDTPVGANRFILKRILGQGGMGTVWLARDERLGELVALKFLPPQIRFDAASLASLRRETLRSHKLSHPNIVRIHDLHEPEGENPFIGMEYVAGPTLGTLRAQQPDGIFRWTKLAPLVRQLCDALDYAHGENVIHRDLKPANMMLDARDRLKLADFGIAAVLSDSQARLSTNSISGTPAYMSPQQINGATPGPTDDIYSLGATLYELLAGTPPFYTGQIIHQALNNPPVALQQRLTELELKNDLPTGVEAMIMACLAKDPSQRPQSARAVADWIGLQPTPHPKSLEATLTPAESFETRTQPQASVGKYKTVGLVFLILAALSAGAWLGTVKSRSQKVPHQASTNLAPTEISAPAIKSPDSNIVFADDFENSATNSRWNWGDQVGKFVVQEGTNHFARLEGNHWTNHFRLYSPLFPLKAEWKSLRFSARLRAQNLKTNPAHEWGGADLEIAWLESAKKPWTSETGFLLLKHDTDWKDRFRVLNIPPGTKFMQLYLKLDESTGVADFDNILVTVMETNKPSSGSASPAPGSVSSQMAFFEDFEKFEPVGDNTKGIRWDPAKQARPGEKWSVTNDGTNHFMELESPSPGNSIIPGYGRVILQPEWKRLKFSLRIRARNLRVNPASRPGGAALFIGWWYKVWNESATTTACVTNDCDWTLVEKIVLIPEGAKRVGFTPMLADSSGIADFDDIKVEVVDQTSAAPPPGSARTSQTLAPRVNSLGMRLVPVPGTVVLFNVWETRVKDFEAFAAATGYVVTNRMRTVVGTARANNSGLNWKTPGFRQTPLHPVCGVSWYDAKAFCKWLTDKEHESGLIGKEQYYRLPTDVEWSRAVGLTNEFGVSPAERNKRVEHLFPWGRQWPPPAGAGNYAGEEAVGISRIKGYADGFTRTAPAGSFKPNRYGIYDLGGNVWEWCEDPYEAPKNWGRVLRGCSWNSFERTNLVSSVRFASTGSAAQDNWGFRIVLSP